MTSKPVELHDSTRNIQQSYPSLDPTITVSGSCSSVCISMCIAASTGRAVQTEALPQMSVPAPTWPAGVHHSGWASTGFPS